MSTFVLDHYGTPVGGLGPCGRSTGHTPVARQAILARWRDDLLALAQLPNVFAKHSGLGMPLLGLPPDIHEGADAYPRARNVLAPLVAHVHAAFGVDRTLWASNYPIDKPTRSLPRSLSLVLEAIGPDVDRKKLTRSNAQRVYRCELG